MSILSKKHKSILSALAALGAVGGTALLASSFYRRPTATLVTMARVGLRLSGVREDTCMVNGLPMHYYSAGRRGTPIILIHGLGNSAEIWSSLIPLLSKDFLVYAPDMPGFGKTPLAPEGVTIRTHVQYLKHFIDALGYPHVTLVGNSLGGWIATQYAAAYPANVEHLYLLNSAGLRREEMNSPYAVSRAEAQRSANHILGFSFPLPGFVLDDIVRTSQMTAYSGFVKGYDRQEELESVLSLVQVPTTIIWGERDKIFPVSCAYDLQTGIANAELRLLPNVGHMPQVQAPFEVARIIREHKKPD
nr:alpha/beta fold hydrolase [Ktedonobacteraceae bacterium]